jgi:hypothetical protein
MGERRGESGVGEEKKTNGGEKGSSSSEWRDY